MGADQRLVPDRWSQAWRGSRPPRSRRCSGGRHSLPHTIWIFFGELETSGTRSPRPHGAIAILSKERNKKTSNAVPRLYLEVRDLIFELRGKQPFFKVDDIQLLHYAGIGGGELAIEEFNEYFEVS